HLDHAAPFRSVVVPTEAEIADKLLEARQTPEILVLVLLGEFDKVYRLGIAAHDRIGGGLEHRGLACEAEHCAVGQLASNWPELDDVPRGIHRRDEAAEVTGADRAAAEQRRELELDAGRERERALGAHKDVREVEIVAPGHQRIEIVAADPTLHLGK